ncbi:hypothetical protein PM082_016769 [Marasmius tenuissimus]|nr:hypothetical protein PM082_016769 [Marasmius tenuissimus]
MIRTGRPTWKPSHGRMPRKRNMKRQLGEDCQPWMYDRWLELGESSKEKMAALQGRGGLGSSGDAKVEAARSDSPAIIEAEGQLKGEKKEEQSHPSSLVVRKELVKIYYLKIKTILTRLRLKHPQASAKSPSLLSGPDSHLLPHRAFRLLCGELLQKILPEDATRSQDEAEGKAQEQPLSEEPKHEPKPTSEPEPIPADEDEAEATINVGLHRGWQRLEVSILSLRLHRGGGIGKSTREEGEHWRRRKTKRRIRFRSVKEEIRRFLLTLNAKQKSRVHTIRQGRRENVLVDVVWSWRGAANTRRSSLHARRCFRVLGLIDFPSLIQFHYMRPNLHLLLVHSSEFRL